MVGFHNENNVFQQKPPDENSPTEGLGRGQVVVIVQQLVEMSIVQQPTDYSVPFSHHGV